MREGKFEIDKKDIENIGYGNLPEWANTPKEFWAASDYYERANGRVYHEFEIALPNELTPDQRQKLVDEFCQQQFGDKHTYSYAIHDTDSALKKNIKNAHVHIMFHDRMNDKIIRTPEIYFKRSNNKNPEKGGATKNRRWHDKEMPKLKREQCFELQNKYLREAGFDKFLDSRTLLEQRIEALQNGEIIKAEKLNREPEIKLGPNAHMLKKEITKLKRENINKNDFEQARENFVEQQKTNVKLAYYTRVGNRIQAKLDGLEKEINKQELDKIGDNRAYRNFYLAKKKLNIFKQQRCQLEYEKDKLKIITPPRALLMAKSIYAKRMTKKDIVFVDNEHSRNQIKKIADGILKKDAKYLNLYFALKTGIGKTDEKIREYEQKIINYGKNISNENQKSLDQQANKRNRNTDNQTGGQLSAKLDFEDDVGQIKKSKNKGFGY